jgi:heme o synthase
VLLRPEARAIPRHAGATGQRRWLSGGTNAGAEQLAKRKASEKGALRKWGGIYMEVSKARLSALVVATTSAGFLFAGGPVHWSALAAVTVGTTLAAASANTFNQTIEREYDALMRRTRQRPLPTGRISPAHAAGFGVATGVASTAMLAATTNPLTAGLGAANILLYAGVYTPLKRRHNLNTWVGAVVGAIPPVMGWTAAGGDLLCAEAGLLSATLFLWQFPHFFSLAWLAREDYARGKYCMVPVSDSTGAATASIVLRYSAYAAPLPFAAWGAGLTTAMFPLESVAINGYLLYLSSQFYRDPGNQNARKVFKCSLWYLPVMMAAMIVHKKEWTRPGEEQPQDASADFISALIPSVKAAGAAACPHERAILHSLDDAGVADEQQQQQLQRACPAIVARETGSQVGAVVATGAATSATLTQ